MVKILNSIFGYERKSTKIHSQKNQFAREMLAVSVQARKLNRLIESTTAYRIANATGRIRHD